MTDRTDPRVEAAARALCSADGYSPDGGYITPVNFLEIDVNWKVYVPDAEIAIKAADAVTQQLSPRNRTDTERLDWLENGPVCETMKHGNAVYIVKESFPVIIERNYRHAIDAAMDGERGDE